MKKYNLREKGGSEHQTYALGIKEVSLLHVFCKEFFNFVSSLFFHENCAYLFDTFMKIIVDFSNKWKLWVSSLRFFCHPHLDYVTLYS